MLNVVNTKYNKFVVAVAAAVVAGVNAYFGDNSQVVTVLVTVLGALGVYTVHNK